jgi:hypothetical protein
MERTCSKCLEEEEKNMPIFIDYDEYLEPKTIEELPDEDPHIDSEFIRKAAKYTYLIKRENLEKIIEEFEKIIIKAGFSARTKISLFIRETIGIVINRPIILETPENKYIYISSDELESILVEEIIKRNKPITEERLMKEILLAIIENEEIEVEKIRTTEFYVSYSTSKVFKETVLEIEVTDIEDILDILKKIFFEIVRNYASFNMIKEKYEWSYDYDNQETIYTYETKLEIYPHDKTYISTEDIINTYANLIDILKLEETKDLIRTLKKLKEKFKPEFYEVNYLVLQIRGFE